MKITSYSSGSHGNLHTVEHNGTKIMLDCGLPWKQVKKHLGFTTHDVSGILVSHRHLDHFKGVHEAIRAGRDVWINEDSMARLVLAGHRSHLVKNGTAFDIGCFTIVPFQLEHDVQCTGFLLSTGEHKILYATDTAFIRNRFHGLTHIMCEVNYCDSILGKCVENGITSRFLADRVISTHFGLGNVLEFLKENDLSRVQEIRVIHLSNAHSDEKMIYNKIREQTGKHVVIV